MREYFILFHKPSLRSRRALSNRERWPARPTVTESVPTLNPAKMTAQRADMFGALNRQSGESVKLTEYALSFTYTKKPDGT